MVKGIGRSSSARQRPCGATAACRWYQSAGCCCAIRSGASHRRRCCALILAGSPADHPLVHPALADRGHIPGGSRSSGCRDSAAVVGSRCHPYHTVLVWTVLDCNPADGPTRSARPNGCLDRQLVPQVSSDLRGCSGRRAAGHLARDRFTHIPTPAQNAKTLTGSSAMLGLRALPRRVIGQSRA